LKRPFGIASAVIMLAAAPALAQLSAQDKAVADAFFADGLKLLRAGKYADACPKLAESERIDPAVGTALYLGECYERTGRVASAQAMFQEGYDFARRRGDTRAAIAKDHHDKLVPSTLTLTLAPGARAAGLEVKRDGVTISTLELGLALPMDGGTHTIVASAPGKKAFTGSVVVPIKEGAATFAIPILADEDRIITPPIATESHGSGRRTIGLAVAGAGLAGIVLGSVAGIIATVDWSSSNSTDNGCNANTTACTTEHGVDLRSSAQTWATVSTVGFIAGGVLAAVGVILFVTAPKSRASTAWMLTPFSASYRF
jgi:hypothetical protein